MNPFITQRCLITALLAFSIAIAPTAHADDDLDEHEIEGPLSVMVLGSGGPMAVAGGRASAGYLIFTDGKPRVLMDVGGGTYQRVAEAGLNLADLDIILLSHLHADHTGDLTPMIKSVYFHNNLAGKTRSNPIHIYGPIANGVPFPNTMVPQYPSTSEYAHGHYAMPGGVERYLNLFVKAISGQASTFAYKAHDISSTVAGATIENLVNAPDGLVIDAIAVNHGPVPAVGYRITYKSKTVVYSGDTSSASNNMITLATGADLLIYDTAIMDDLPLNPVFHALHTSPTRLAAVAVSANPKNLVLSHLTPVTEPRIDIIKSIIRSAGYTGNIETASDLAVYNLGDD